MGDNWAFEHVRCNLCGSDNARALYRKKGIDTGLVYNIVGCRECGLVYVNPRLTKESLATLYNLEYYGKKINIRQSTYEEREHGIETEGISRIESIKCRKPFRPGDTLLDVGCGMGGLIYDAIKAGYRVTATEYSEEAYNYLKKQGLDARLGEFETMDLGGEKFDIITAIGVLEHVRDPLSFLKKVGLCLKNGGMFFYVTANFDSLASRIWGVKWSYIEPDRHIYYYTPSTITSYFNKVGLKPFYFKDSFDTGRKLTRYLMKMGLVGKGKTVPKTAVEKLILSSLNLLDDIRNINLPYAIKDHV